MDKLIGAVVILLALIFVVPLILKAVLFVVKGIFGIILFVVIFFFVLAVVGSLSAGKPTDPPDPPQS